jgi:ABC-type phosphate/phosphonate transport system permease subunit
LVQHGTKGFGGRCSVWNLSERQGTNLKLRELSTGFSEFRHLSRAFPPDFSILPPLAGAIIETIQISILGTTSDNVAIP